MNKLFSLWGRLTAVAVLLLLLFSAFCCKQESKATGKQEEKVARSQAPEYFQLRPELEKKYGYSQAIRVGNRVKVGGVISIDDNGNAIGKDDFLQQMKSCYASIERVLQRYGCTFDDVIVENLYTTSMVALHKNAFYRHEIYNHHFPGGNWIGVKELGMPEAMIEIEIEALVPSQ